MDRVHKGGAKFDYEKAKWFNHQHIQRAGNERLAALAAPFFEKEHIRPDPAYLAKVVGLIKERCHLLSDFVSQGRFFFEAPAQPDLETIRGKWNAEKSAFFRSWIERLETTELTHDALEASFGDQAAAAGIKKGDLMLPLRIMLVGGKFGPGVFDIIPMVGKDAVRERVLAALAQLQA